MDAQGGSHLDCSEFRMTEFHRAPTDFLELERNFSFIVTLVSHLNIQPLVQFVGQKQCVAKGFLPEKKSGFT